MIALGRLRQSAVRRRLDFQPPVTGHAAGARIITADVRNGIDIAAAIDGRLDLVALAETPLTLDHCIGSVDTINDDGYAGTAGNHNVEATAGKGCRIRRDEKCQCDAKAHRLGSRFPSPNLIQRVIAGVKAAGQTADKANAQAWIAAQLREMALSKR